MPGRQDHAGALVDGRAATRAVSELARGRRPGRAAAPKVAAAPPKPASNQIQRFDPACGKDSACEVWKRFQVNHPFPTQTLAGQRAGDRLVLIFSEPALPKARLTSLVKSAFGADLRDVQTRRWMIGEDGWLEDMVVSVNWQPAMGPTATDPMADPLLRDRLALLAGQLWGTAFGLRLEAANAPFAARARSQAPLLDPRPGEVSVWLRDANLRWRNQGLGEGLGRNFDELIKAARVGAFGSADKQLSLLLLSQADIEQAQKSPAAFEQNWRAAFRWFAVASDVVLGAAWTDVGALALVGRMRRVPADVIAPLRFETFALLARAGSRELAQSYERTTPLAGKMLGGHYPGADWAPIYLSRPLIHLSSAPCSTTLTWHASCPTPSPTRPCRLTRGAAARAALTRPSTSPNAKPPCRRWPLSWNKCWLAWPAPTLRPNWWKASASLPNG